MSTATWALILFVGPKLLAVTALKLFATKHIIKVRSVSFKSKRYLTWRNYGIGRELLCSQEHLRFSRMLPFLPHRIPQVNERVAVYVLRFGISPLNLRLRRNRVHFIFARRPGVPLKKLRRRMQQRRSAQHGLIEE